MSKFAMLFSGQGSQYVGMGKALYQRYEVAKQIFNEASETLSMDLASLCFNGGIEELTKTENTQPAILTVSVAAYQAYMEEVGIAPDFMAGHSLGEISALTCAGALKFADAVRIARARGTFMTLTTKDSQGGMAAVTGLELEAIQSLCDQISSDAQFVVVSNLNALSQYVISGHKSKVASACEELKQMGAQVTPLQVSAAFHSPLMQPAADLFRDELGYYHLEEGQAAIRVLSNVTGLPYESKEEIVDLLTTQIVAPVRWSACMAYLESHDVAYALEIGPGHTLRNLVSKNTVGMKSHSFDRDDIVAIKKSAAAFRKVAKAVPPFLSRCLGIAVSTRNSNWDQEEYQRGVIVPYKQIQQLKEHLETNGVDPSKEQMIEGMTLLKTIFETKKLPKLEQIERFHQLLSETGTMSLLQEVVDSLEERILIH
ncbi:ACP S-malonyltransferase [Paenibacillus sp. SI8]|uniref:ACP S-malonyltransferase n=1 Tax=unclassified Paenibacillus TaxID=185978 RepID=UPI003467EB35